MIGPWLVAQAKDRIVERNSEFETACSAGAIAERNSAQNGAAR